MARPASARSGAGWPPPPPPPRAAAPAPPTRGLEGGWFGARLGKTGRVAWWVSRESQKDTKLLVVALSFFGGGSSHSIDASDFAGYTFPIWLAELTQTYPNN